MTTSTRKRLRREDWLAAAEAVLAAQGAAALKAEPLARHMQTTKGSFYWHFRDVPDLHAQVLARWEAAVMAATDAAASETGGPAARLRDLAQALADPAPGRDTEAAIRAWAATDATARDVMGRVDAIRRAALQELLAETGISNPEMAQIIHAAALGMTLLDDVAADRSPLHANKGRADACPDRKRAGQVDSLTSRLPHEEASAARRAAIGSLVDLVLALR